MKAKHRRMQRPTTDEDESRYSSVKRSMGAIKTVIVERSRIKKYIAMKDAQEAGPGGLAGLAPVERDFEPGERSVSQVNHIAEARLYLPKRKRIILEPKPPKIRVPKVKKSKSKGQKKGVN